MKGSLITIINPVAGTDEPILGQLSKMTSKYKITNEVLVTQSPNDTKKLAQKARRAKPDAVLVYGGDGTIVDVANVLYGSHIPLIIIPGGTANVIAKELGIPLNSKEAFKILGRQPKEVKVNVAKIGRNNMILRIEVGILANMVKSASSEMKESLGILAYPITAIKEALKAPTSHYTLTIDGQKHEIDGVGMMIANIGNIGLPGVSLQSKVNCSDDLLDVLVLQSTDLATLVAVGSSALIGTKKPLALKHWQGKKIRVSISPKQTIISDDKPLKAARFTVSLKPDNLTVLI